MTGMAREYISYARQLASNGSYSKSLDLYFMAFERSPSIKTDYEAEFRAILIKVNDILDASSKVDDVFKNFNKAVDIFPSNIYLLNEIGKYLYKYGYYVEAWTQFQKALIIDSGYVVAEKNLNSIKNLLVERWHFRMLNDKLRNDRYREAIYQNVEPKKTTVLDLGTGTGLLAMFAAERNPKSISACDGSEAMVSLAENILEENRLILAIDLINKMSTSMTQLDIREKRSLLITELFDAGLFGEHILKSLSHAWENFLAPDAVILPNKAEFFVIGINSDLLSCKYQLSLKAKEFLKVDFLNIHIITSEDTYDCDDVHLYKDVKYITHPESVVKIDFNDVNDVNDKLNSSDPYIIQFRGARDGIINVYVGWFNLYLTDNIMLTTDPRDKNRANAWQQAIFFDALPKRIDKNETIFTTFLLESEKLILRPVFDCDMRISPETLRFLNDMEYMEKIKKCIGMACVYLGQLLEMDEVDILDLCPFPMFGLFMLTRGVRSLVCYAKTEEDKLFIEEVVRVNHVSIDKVTYVVGDDWSYESLKDDKFHAIFCHFLDLSGDLDVRLKDIALNLKNSNLVCGGLFMPANVTLMGEIVSSNWLDITNKVNDHNVGYTMAKYVNKYQVSQIFGVDYTNLDYVPLTEPINLGNCLELTPEVINAIIKTDGYANGIICWYSLEIMENISEITTKRPHSFIDGIAFLANPIIRMVKGTIANFLRCVDSDGAFKLILDVEQ